MLQVQRQVTFPHVPCNKQPRVRSIQERGSTTEIPQEEAHVKVKEHCTSVSQLLSH